MTTGDIRYDDFWYVEIGYRCPGQPLDAEFEGLLEFTYQVSLMGARFDNGRRFITYNLGERETAVEFADCARQCREDLVILLLYGSPA